jgi:hypothetical protein
MEMEKTGRHCGGDESGTHECKVGAKIDGTIIAYQWNMTGVRNPAIDKTPECTTIRHARGTQQWAFTNRGYLESIGHGAPGGSLPHSSSQ